MLGLQHTCALGCPGIPLAPRISIGLTAPDEVPPRVATDGLCEARARSCPGTKSLCPMLEPWPPARSADAGGGSELDLPRVALAAPRCALGGRDRGELT